MKILLLGIILLSQLHAEDKLAQTGFQFLSVMPDARSAALMGAVAMTPGYYSTALWTNPSYLADMNTKLEIMANQAEWIADINYYSMTTAFLPANGRYGVLGLSMLYVDYGNIEGTIIAENELGYLEMNEPIKPSAYAAGLGYAIRLSDRFAVGGQIKLTNQNLGPAVRSLSDAGNDQNVDNNEVSTLAFDLGTQYKTGLKSLVFSMAVRNFSREVKYAMEGFQLPLTFNIGVSMNLLDLYPGASGAHSLVLAADAAHPRSYPEFVQLGAEYSFLSTFFLRIGYMSNRAEEDFSYGFGFRKFGLGVDYAYTPFGVFDNVQRFSINFSF